MWHDDELTLAEEVLRRCRARDWMLATAESCTGGMISALLTEIAGSSDVFDRAFVTYSNAAKTAMLGVPADVIRTHGAVSTPVAEAMADGAIDRSSAHITISVTGVAGPGGGSADKPVGTVCFGLATISGPLRSQRKIFAGLDRAGVRRATVKHALEMVRKAAI